MNPASQSGYVCLWCEDLPAQRDVATAAGLEITYEDENMVLLTCGGFRMVLQRAEGPKAHLAGSTQFGLEVADLDARSERLRAEGADLVLDAHPIGHGRRATVVRLPSGQLLELVGE